VKFTTVIDQVFLLTIHEISEIPQFQTWRWCAISKIFAKRFSDRSLKVQFMCQSAEFGIKYDHQSLSRKLRKRTFYKIDCA
jgi:hypothetical protein